MNVTASEPLGMNNIIQFLRHREQLILFTKTNCLMLFRNLNAVLSHMIHKNSVVEELLNVTARDQYRSYRINEYKGERSQCVPPA